MCIFIYPLEKSGYQSELPTKLFEIRGQEGWENKVWLFHYDGLENASNTKAFLECKSEDNLKLEFILPEFYEKEFKDVTYKPKNLSQFYFKNMKSKIYRKEEK